MSNTVGYGWAKPGVFQLGVGKTLAIPMDVHASSRRKLVELLRSKYATASGVVLLKGGDEQSTYDTDGEPLFRQDSWFNYLFGVKEPGVIGAIDIATGRSTLFIPKLPDEYRIWCGEIHPPSVFVASYGVDEVVYTDSLAEWLSAHQDGSVHILHGKNSDSGLFPKQVDFFTTAAALPEAVKDRIDSSSSSLFHALSTARVTKSSAEIEVMRYCAWVASQAHVQVMRSTKPGMVEYELEATFMYEIYKNGGCRRCAYTSICACGPNGATLHYGHAGAPNDRTLKDGDIALLDMGAEYHGYVSDITCSFPVGSRFTPDQVLIFEGVLNAQRAVLALMEPGTPWPSCHRTAEVEIIKALQTAGVLSASSDASELADKGLGAVFFPHGLGHLIGCDTHDVGGFITGTPERLSTPGLSKLRTARVLEEGMVLTNEPGCYFIDALLDAALADPVKSQFINPQALARFRGFGGVRLEDVVLVKAAGQGAENLTTCPRTVAEVESVLAGGQWPPARDEAPWLRRAWTKLAPGGEGMVKINVEGAQSFN